VAGAFYPADPQALAEVVDRCLAGADVVAPAPPPKAIVAPHAGYVYSGPIAGTAYRALGDLAAVRRVVVLGPAHRVALRGMAVPTVDAFATPLGDVPVDAELRARALACAGVAADDRPHHDEHGLEVHLPFLQRLLGPEGWAVLPVVVGATPPEVVADLLDATWGGPETLVVVSSDLSHYHPHTTAQRLDAATARAVLDRRPEAVEPDGACGVHPLRGLLVAARRHDLVPRLLDLRTSADTAGDPDRVVGYGAFALVPA
jgi:AmmeMemoRadiSam system protein B